ncbi:MAG: hypothetical protein E6I55_05290 [Chloroflexi bacterium]|nr:MAG: hypothetical protein E6I55_05290 [Chloroflexota bacterium]
MAAAVLDTGFGSAAAPAGTGEPSLPVTLAAGRPVRSCSTMRGSIICRLSSAARSGADRVVADRRAGARAGVLGEDDSLARGEGRRGLFASARRASRLRADRRRHDGRDDHRCSLGLSTLLFIVVVLVVVLLVLVVVNRDDVDLDLQLVVLVVAARVRLVGALGFRDVVGVVLLVARHGGSVCASD